MTVYVALLRGINVGTAKQVPMEQLKAAYAGLGLTDVRTHLRSGNVVFGADVRPDPAALEVAVEHATGVSSRVLVLSRDQLHRIAQDCPLTHVATDDARLVVGFTSAPPDATNAPDPASLAPEQLVVGERAIYQWCPDGVSKSRVPPAFWRGVAPLVTARNWRTVTALRTMCG